MTGRISRAGIPVLLPGETMAPFDDPMPFRRKEYPDARPDPYDRMAQTFVFGFPLFLVGAAIFGLAGAFRAFSPPRALPVPAPSDFNYPRRPRR